MVKLNLKNVYMAGEQMDKEKLKEILLRYIRRKMA